MKVTLGRIVHYKIRTGEVRPAIVVNVLESEKVNLQVFMDNDTTLWCSSIPFSGNWPAAFDSSIEVFPVGTWTWPPRES